LLRTLGWHLLGGAGPVIRPPRTELGSRERRSSAAGGAGPDLYDVEALVPGDFPGNEQAQRLRRDLRNERSRKILEKIREKCLSQGRLPRSGLGKANRYVLNYWDGLKLFLEDPLIPLDNNPVERALRGPVIGRKNHYGSKSKRGTEVAAVLYSLCETAKLCGVNPKAYLIHAARAAIRQPGSVILPLPEGQISLTN
jgi:transposase